MQLEDYLKELFGDGTVGDLPPASIPLPFYLKNSYELSVNVIHGITVLFARPNKRETPATLKMHSYQLSKAYGLPCIVWLEEIDFQEKKRLCQNGTQFVVPRVVFFAPHVGISINERIKEVKKTKVKAFTPLIQTIYLYLLYNRKSFADKPIRLSAISARTKVSIMMVKRAIDALVSVGLAEQNQEGISFLQHQAAYVEKALPYLADPVKERFFVTKEDFENHLKGILPHSYCGIDGLQYAPYISDARRLVGYDRTFAFNKKDVAHIPKTIKMARRYEQNDIEIQIWNYALHGYGEKCECEYEYPEPLSLYLSLRNEKDERIQAALEELLEGIKNDGWA